MFRNPSRGVVIATATTNPSRVTRSRLNRLISAVNSLDGYHVEAALVVESDSKNTSGKQLFESRKGRIRHADLGDLRFKFPEREDRLAYARNEYLGMFINDFSDAELLLVFDSDQGFFLRSGIKNAFDHIDTYGAIFGSPFGLSYDAAALRVQGYIEDDYRNLDKLESPSFFLRICRYWLLVVVPLKRFRSDSKEQVQTVLSAFDGLALYQRQCLINVQYSSKSAHSSIICEHVGLHNSIVRNGNQLVRMRNFWFLSLNKHLLAQLTLGLVGPVVCRASKLKGYRRRT